MKKMSLLLLMGLYLHALPAPAMEDQGPRVAGGWVREGPPHAMALAAYLRLRNPGPEPRHLVGVSSPQFSGAMMHATVIEGGIARMRHLDGLDIPGAGEVSFAPGGRHIMLMGPRRELHVGDHIELILKFADGLLLEVTLPVLRQAPAE